MLIPLSANWYATALAIAWHVHVFDSPWSKGSSLQPGIGDVFPLLLIEGTSLEF